MIETHLQVGEHAEASDTIGEATSYCRDQGPR